MPQSVSFAAMAGVPAAFGLYTAFVPVLAYVLMGSSRHLVSRQRIAIFQFSQSIPPTIWPLEMQFPDRSRTTPVE